MGNLMDNWGDEIQERLERDKRKKCPECGSTEIMIEKKPNGYTTCISCRRHRLHSEFWSVLPNSMVNNMSLDELTFCSQVLYTDKYDSNKQIIEHSKYIEVIGGDGSLLKAINKFKHLNKPFFGIAGGTLNFLMNDETSIVDDADYIDFSLIKVKVTYKKENEDYFNPKDAFDDVTEEFQAFNDILFGGDMNTWAEFDVKDADGIIGKFKGCGVGIATAQGSTGFNRNNEGSIMSLNSDQWFITSGFGDRNIRIPIDPNDTVITGYCRDDNLTVWADGKNNIIRNVSKIELSIGEKVTVIFNDYESFKKKRRV